MDSRAGVRAKSHLWAASRKDLRRRDPTLALRAAETHWTQPTSRGALRMTLSQHGPKTEKEAPGRRRAERQRSARGYGQGMVPAQARPDGPGGLLKERPTSASSGAPI